MTQHRDRLPSMTYRRRETCRCGRPTAHSTWKPTACARNAACSASSAIRKPRPSPRSACTRCSTAARKPRASSASTASGSTPSGALGLVGDTFSNAATIERLPGIARHRPCPLFHHGETILRNVQPLFAELDARRLRRRPQRQPHQRPDPAPRTRPRRARSCQSTSDTEVILHLVARSRKRDRFSTASSRLSRADRGRLFARRADQQEADRRPRSARHPPAGAGRTRRPPDPRVGDLRARHHRRELRARRRERRDRRHLARTASKATSRSRRQPPRPCIFEYIYFARPDSVVGGRPVYDVRKSMGAQLARESPVDADVVIPVPDSGVPAALGYAQESGIPFELGIIRNHYVGRTFIQPTQIGARARRAPEAQRQPRVVKGKRIVLIDDSHRARHHLGEDRADDARRRRTRSAFPHLLARRSPHPDYYGIDTPERDKLLAATHSLEEMRKLIGCEFARLPVGRGHLPGHGRDRPRPSPPAIHRPLLHRRLSDAAHRPRQRISRRASNCRCSPKPAERPHHPDNHHGAAARKPHCPRHWRVSRYRTRAREGAGASGCACHCARTHTGRA